MGAPEKVGILIRLPASIADALTAEAARLEISRAELIRRKLAQ